MDGRTIRQFDGLNAGWTDGWTNRRLDKWTDGQTQGRTRCEELGLGDMAKKKIPDFFRRNSIHYLDRFIFTLLKII